MCAINRFISVTITIIRSNPMKFETSGVRGRGFRKDGRIGMLAATLQSDALIANSGQLLEEFLLALLLSLLTNQEEYTLACGSIVTAQQ